MPTHPMRSIFYNKKKFGGCERKKYNRYFAVEMCGNKKQLQALDYIDTLSEFIKPQSHFI
jgi:hypothetical protein